MEYAFALVIGFIMGSGLYLLGYIHGESSGFSKCQKVVNEFFDEWETERKKIHESK